MLLQCYSHILTTSLGVLDIDWVRQYKGTTFAELVEAFYQMVRTLFHIEK